MPDASGSDSQVQDRTTAQVHTEESVRRELRGLVFQLGPGGAWETAERYLSGDVVGKLEDARRWTALDEEYRDNVAALERVQPAPVRMVPGDGAEGLTVPFGAPWVPAQVYLDFLAHLFPAYGGGSRWGVELVHVAETATWILQVSNKYLLTSVENTRTHGTRRMTAIDLVECGLRLQLPTVYDEGTNGAGWPTKVKNPQETALAQAKLAEIRERWAAWLPRDLDRCATLEREYNRRYNRVVPRTYDGSKLSFPGLSVTFQGQPFVPRPHQTAGALRILERGEIDDTCMLAYYPGAGKTASAILGVMKRLQLGMSQKCVCVVPKSVLHQWQATWYELYPGHADWVLAGTDRAFDAQNRRRFLTTAALGDARVVLLTYEQFRTIPLRPETFRAYLSREVRDLEAAMRAVEEGDPAQRNLQRTLKQRERSLADFEAKYQSKWDKVVKAGDADVSWEMWGCDLLCMDEAHYLKNLGFSSKLDGISGMPRAESQRAFDGAVKLHYVTTPELFPELTQARAGHEIAVSVRLPSDATADQVVDALSTVSSAGPSGSLAALPLGAVVTRAETRPLHQGKGVFLTGTPVTNSLAETWVMMRLLQPRLLRQSGLWHFDSWAATFTTQHPSPEMDAVGAWRVRTRLKFHNLPELQDMLGLCWDRVDPRAAMGTRPTIVGERMRVVETPGSDDLRAYTQELADRAELVRTRKVEPEDDNMLKITHDGRCASVFNGTPSLTWPHDRECATCGGTGTIGARAEDRMTDGCPSGLTAPRCPVHGVDVGALVGDPPGHDAETCNGCAAGGESAPSCQTCAGTGRVPHRTKLDALAETVWDLYCHSDAMSGAQLVFVDLFTPKSRSTFQDGAADRIGGAASAAASVSAAASGSGGGASESDGDRKFATRRRTAERARDAADGTGVTVALTPEEEFVQRGVYGVIRDKLVRAGCLADEVAYIHDAAGDEERRDLFAAVNTGRVRVLIGSTQKMGLGVNVQKRAYAAHHVTVPWRPDWLDQANKRVDRDGNTCEAVHLVCYPTIGSYDVVLWQMIEVKAEFVSQINSGTYAGRSADDIGDLQIDATTAKAIALGDLRVVEKVKLELELGQLQRSFKMWKNEHLRSRFELESLPRQVAERERDIDVARALLAHRDANQQVGPTGRPYFSCLLRQAMGSAADLTDGTDAAARAANVASWQTLADRTVADGRIHVLAESLRHRLNDDGLLVGQYRGLDLLLCRDAHGIHLEARHRVPPIVDDKVAALRAPTAKLGASAGPDSRVLESAAPVNDTTGGADTALTDYGAHVVAKNVGQRGVGAMAQLESALASLETQVHRMVQQMAIMASRFDSLRAETAAWPHQDRAAALLARYEELCVAVATARIVDRQTFRFT